MKQARLLAILLSIVMLLTFVAACNKDSTNTPENSTSPEASQNVPGSTSPGETSPETTQSTTGSSGSGRESITIALSADGGTLSPAHCSGDNMRICLLVQEPLWDMLADGTVIYLLAESVDINGPDYWTLHLRKGVTFSNGNPFTASDVLFTLQVTKDSGIGTPRINNVDVERSYASDDHTVELYWPAYHDAAWQGLSDVMIYDEESYDIGTASSSPIGTGPYIVSEYMLNSHCNLERRDDYWGGLQQLKNINFRFVAETSQVVNALETGKIDIGPVASADYDYVSKLPGFVVDRIYQGNFLSVGFAMNQSSAFYNNKEARYAVAHAIDKQAILDLVYYGYGRVLNGPNTELNINFDPAYNNAHSTYSTGYDLDVARQYAESSGLAGKEITIITTSTPALLAASEMIQNMLKDINVNAVVNAYDSASIRQLSYDPNSTYDMSVSLGINPALCYQGPLINGIVYNPVTSAGGWDRCEEFLENCMAGWNTFDDTERAKAVKWIVDTYVDECLVYGLVDIQFCYAYKDDIKVFPPFKVQMNFRYQNMEFND